jgi:outer membrane protein, heavy metal efflux system
VTAGKLKKNRAIEAWDMQRLSWDAEAQRMRVLNDLKIRYYELLGAQQAVALSQDLVRIATEGYETTDRLSRAQQASRKDLLQAKVQMNTVRLNLREAEHRYDSAWSALAVLVGVPDLERAPVVGILAEETPDLDWDECWTQLEAQSPQLQAALARVQFAWSELARESVEAIPNLNVQVVAERDRATNSSTVSTLLSVPVPVFNRNQGNIHRANAEIRQANAEFERVRLVLEDLLNDAFRRYKIARDQVASLRGEIVPDAQETLQLTTQGYKQGEFGILEVLAARQTYFESSLAYVEALTELQKVTTEIQGLQLTGGLNPAEVGTALQGAGGVSRQRAALNKLQESTSKRLLPAAVQTGR